MMNKNSSSPRKTLIQADCTRLPFAPGEFDIVNIDAVMHHLVSDDGYAATVRRIGAFLGDVVRTLRPGGIVAIREIFHESFIIDNAHSRLMYEVTRRTLPQPIAAVMRRAGIQTANVGVCFLS